MIRARRYLASMQLHALQTDPVWRDFTANRLHIEAAMNTLDCTTGDYVVLPEMCETGWTSDAESLQLPTQSLAWLSALAARHGVWIQAGLGEQISRTSVANSAAVAAPDGSIRAIYRKYFLFPSERESFVAGERLFLIDTGKALVCPLICYDLRFPELWRLAALAGAEVFAVSSSWPSVRHEHWRALLIARAIENQAYVVAANRTGSDPTQSYSGGSTIITHQGERIDEVLCEQRNASARFAREELVAWRAQFPALANTQHALLGSTNIVRV